MTHVYKGFPERTDQGGYLVTKDGVPLDPGPSQKLDNHSPDGFMWGVNPIMYLDMTIGTDQLKSFRMIPYFSKRASAMPFNIPQIFFTTIEMVKMESGEITVISTKGTATAKGHPETFTFLSFPLTKARLLTLGTEILPSLIANILEELATLKAMSFSFQINRGTIMISPLKLPTEKTTLSATNRTDMILAEKLSTLQASDIVLISHVSPSLDIIPEECPKLHPKISYKEGSGSGPSQLALALLLDVTGDPDLAMRFHQEFKEEMIAPLPIDSPWVMLNLTIKSWVNQKQILEGIHPL